MKNSQANDRFTTERRSYHLRAGLLLVLGLALGGAGALFALQEVPSSSGPAAAELKDRCAEQVTASNMLFSEEQGNVRVNKGRSHPDSRSVLTSSSLIIEACDGYMLKEFCIGDECGAEGFSMLLAPL